MNKRQHPLSEADYDAIEAAVMETERGRWFLARYAERNRNSDTTVLLDAIAKLERSMRDSRSEASSGDVSEVCTGLAEMAATIARTRREVAAIRPQAKSGGIDAAGEELEAVAAATGSVGRDILEAAEAIREIVRTMREAGVEEDQCENIDTLVSAICFTCRIQSISGQQISATVSALCSLEEKLASMRHLWDRHPTDVRPGNGAPVSQHALCGYTQTAVGARTQEDFDRLLTLSDDPARERLPAPAPTDIDYAGLDDEFFLDDTSTEFEEDSLYDTPTVEERNKADADVPHPQGRIIMVRKPQPGEDTDDAEDTSSTSPSDGSSDGRDTVLLNDLGDDEKLALFS